MNDTKIIYKIFGQSPIKLHIEPIFNENGVTNRVASKKTGIIRYCAEFQNGKIKHFIGKKKSAKIIANGIFLLSKKDISLLFMLILNHKILGYNNSYIRESIIYENIDDSLKKYLPDVMGSCANRLKGNCFIAMEEFPPSPMTESNVYRLIDAISEFHARYYNDIDSAKKLKLNRFSVKDYQKNRNCIKKLFNQLSEENLRFFGKEKTDKINSFIDNIDKEFSTVQNRRTLTHNDFSIRNIYDDKNRICIYDWELACWQNPEHDIVELIISVMTNMTDKQVVSALNYYRKLISELTGITLSDKEYSTLLQFNTLEFCVNKLSILRIACHHLKLNYIDDIVTNTSRMIDIVT